MKEKRLMSYIKKMKLDLKNIGAGIVLSDNDNINN